MHEFTRPASMKTFVYLQSKTSDGSLAGCEGDEDSGHSVVDIFYQRDVEQPFTTSSSAVDRRHDR